MNDTQLKTQNLTAYEKFMAIGKRNQELNHATILQEANSVNGRVQIAAINTSCPECGEKIVWKYSRDWCRWKCVKCHPLPPKGEFIHVVPENHRARCATCKFLFCIKYEHGDISDCRRYQSRALSFSEVLEISSYFN